jgi:hypothetical protein
LFAHQLGFGLPPARDVALEDVPHSPVGPVDDDAVGAIAISHDETAV